MTITLTLNPEVENRLLARAHARGVSLADFLQEVVTREAGIPGVAPPPFRGEVGNLSDLLLNSPFAGADLDLDRREDYPRPVELG